MGFRSSLAFLCQITQSDVYQNRNRDEASKTTYSCPIKNNNMADSPNQITKLLLPAAQVAGLGLSGFLCGKSWVLFSNDIKRNANYVYAGFGYAFSFVSIPVLLKTSTPDILAKQWLMTYEIGKAAAPPMAVASAICFGFLATQCKPIQRQYFCLEV